jgi:hypothetical protein
MCDYQREYQSEAPTATSDRLCKVITPCDLETHYISTAATQTSDLVCVEQGYPALNLLGQDEMEVIVDDKFECSGCSCTPLSKTNAFADPGAQCEDPEDGFLPVTKSGLVDTQTPGTYVVSYHCSDGDGHEAGVQRRTVHVKDHKCPVCALNGLTDMTQEASFPFVDPGACFTDNYDGKLSSNLTQVEGSVNIHTAGVYKLTYKHTDSSSNSNMHCSQDPCVRSVTVTDTLKPVLWLSYGNQIIHKSDTSDMAATSQTSLRNPASYFADTTTTRKAVVYDTKTELGAAPWLDMQGLWGNGRNVQPNAQACQMACENEVQCKFGTYVTSGARQGECWLSATTGKTNSPCGVPCESFMIVEKKAASRRLLETPARRNSRLAVVGSVAAFFTVGVLLVLHSQQKIDLGAHNLV